MEYQVSRQERRFSCTDEWTSIDGISTLAARRCRLRAHCCCRSACQLSSVAKAFRCDSCDARRTAGGRFLPAVLVPVVPDADGLCLLAPKGAQPARSPASQHADLRSHAV